MTDMTTLVTAEQKKDISGVEERSPLIDGAVQLARTRQRPCLLFFVPEIRHDSTRMLRAAIRQAEGAEVDLLLHSNGGDVHAAYVAARDVKRRFDRVTVFVPLAAKSAAMMLCLIADELVLGPLGELGPLDGQCQPAELADSPADRSGLIPFKALEQLNDATGAMYEGLVNRFVNSVHMKASDACGRASELTSAVFGPLYAQISPTVLAESARGLDLALEHAVRLLRRYRPPMPDRARYRLVRRLINAYPCHCFPVDHEELEELGFPARHADPKEEAILEHVAAIVVDSPPESVIRLVNGEVGSGSGEDSAAV
jgi:hypothetical protein